MNILQDKTYPHMYWIEWPDGTLSDDFYNKTRASWYKVNIQRGLDNRIKT